MGGCFPFLGAPGDGGAQLSMFYEGEAGQRERGAFLGDHLTCLHPSAVKWTQFSFSSVLSRCFECGLIVLNCLLIALPALLN